MDEEQIKDAIHQLGQGLSKPWNRLVNGGNAPKKVKLRLKGVTLTSPLFMDTDLGDSTFHEVTITGGDFTAAQLDKATFMKCKLNQVAFSNSVGNQTKWLHSTLERCTFESANLHGAHFESCRINKCSFKAATFLNSTFTRTTISESGFKDSTLHGSTLPSRLIKCTFENAGLTKTDLQKSVLESTNFVGLTASDLFWNETSFKKCKLFDCNVSEARFSGGNFSEVSFSRFKANNSDFQSITANGLHTAAGEYRNCNFDGATITNSSLEETILSNSTIRSTAFVETSLEMANFLKAVTDTKTSFNNCSTKGMSMNRFSLEMLPDYGGLTVGNRIEMDIHDDAALLRVSYSGFWQWIHLCALGAFVLPYAWFLLSHYPKARFAQEEGCSITLLEALARYTYYGGECIYRPFPSLPELAFYTFLFSLLYNLLRGALLYKAKTLELHETSSGLPSQFSLWNSQVVKFRSWSISWLVAFNLAKWGFWLNLAVVAWHTAHFLSKRVQVP